jgi:hypothetical protein
MQDIRLECTLDGAEYKEYEVLINEQPLGVISWKGDRASSEGCWYTTASDGNLRYFQTQEEVIEFVRDNPLKSATELSAKLKAEAKKLMVIAEEIEVQSTDFEAQDK